MFVYGLSGNCLPVSDMPQLLSKINIDCVSTEMYLYKCTWLANGGCMYPLSGS